MKLTKLTVLCLAFSLLAFGQNVSSSIKGVLTDPSSAGIPNAECTLTNEATGATLKTTSGPDGAFTYPTVQAGTYTLAVQARGFKALETKNIVVTASEIRVLGRITMQLGQLQETITVAAETASLQLASSEKSGVITSEQIQNIAIRGRDFFAYLLTVPGIVDNFSQRRETMTPDSIRGTFINGQRENQKNLAIDGITDLDTGSNSTVHFQP